MTSAQPDPKTGIVTREEEPGGSMTFFEHLTELRKRIINSLISIVIGSFVGFYLSGYFVEFITKPMARALADAHLEPKLIYTHPDGFLFLLGIAFGYFVALPRVLHFLVGFQGMSIPFMHGIQPGTVVPMISINEYFDVILLILMGLGIVFEMPVLVFFLSLFGIVTPKFLMKNFRYAILVIAVIAAIVTPTPDATTMLIFMAPMVGLYFLSVGVSAMVVRKRERRLSQPAEAR